MKNKKTILLIVPAILVIGIIIYNFRSHSNQIDIDIEKILKTSNYSYLSNAAKEYVRNYYNETGEVLLTEKNKVKNEGYLNPDYIEYLSQNSNSTTGYIPNEITYDYNYDYNLNVEDVDNLPRKYDSRNVDGNNYVTPLKRQYNELCWNYAYTSVIETKLLKAGFKSDVSTLNLSERMMDYATTDPISAIDIEKNPYFGKYTLNSLADKGNEYRYTSALVNGLFPIDEQNWNYELEYMGKVKPEDLYDFNKINYQVNEVKFLEDDNFNIGFDEVTNKILKKHIIEDGAVGLSLRVGAGRNYVSYTPTEEEVLNSGSKKNTLYYKAANAQYQSNDHVVSIIGYDDDYLHNVCVAESGELTDAVNNNGTYTCSTGTLKTINGAWITKDSANSSYHYVAYETVNSDYFAIVDVSIRDWDNVYSSTNREAYTSSNNAYTFNKQTNKEKLNSIKFYATNVISDLNVYIDSFDGNGEQLVATINTEIGGMYTIPIESDIILSSDKFKIKFSNAYKLSQFSVFTSNVDDDVVLKIEDAKVVNSFNYQDFLIDYSNTIVTSGVTRNVNDIINIVIKNSNGEDVTNLFNIIRNYSVGNYFNALIRFNNNVPIGKYTGYAYFNDTLYETFNIDIDKYMEKISGDGTEDNPFIITNPAQLDMVRLNQYNHYKLGNDIDLTYDTQNENGLFYNDGLGWEPISYSTCSINTNKNISCSSGFSGSFDGDNHKITGLYINRPEESAVGLFKNTYNNNYAGLNFRNIVLKDVNITGKDYVGGIIGYAYGTTHERTLIFENISVTGNVSGNDYVGGIIGYFNGGTGLDNYLVDNTKCSKRHCLNNLFNSSKIEGNNYVGGIVGLLASYGNFSDNVKWRSTIDAYNWQNNGTIISDNSGAGLIGYILNKNGNIITLNNSINTGIVKGLQDAAIVNDVECNKTSEAYPNCSIVFNNVYYINDKAYNANDLITANNVKKYNISNLKDETIYSSFSDFNTYYKQETIDNVKRIPFVTNAYVEYTIVEDINIEVGEQVDLNDYIYPEVEYIYDQIIDSSIASINSENKITGLKAGNTTLHITSYYDGYEKEVNINVTAPIRTINFDSNGGSKVESITGAVGNSVQKPSDPIKKGYTFKGWYLDNDTFENRFVFSTMPEEDVTVYAKWEIEKYIVTFDANGGSGQMDNQTFTYEEAQSLNAVSFSKTGHTFKNWNTKSDGSGTSYLNKENIKIYEDCTLYAIWDKEFEYTISEYTYDISQRTIDDISLNTSVDDYKSRFTLNEGYSMEVDYKAVGDKEVIYTGAKTRIYLNDELDIEFTNIIRGEVNGDGKINYLDYVSVYNHIQKVKNPSLAKKELENEYLIAANISRDDKVSYLDYVKIYNKIKELKEASN